MKIFSCRKKMWRITVFCCCFAFVQKVFKVLCNFIFVDFKTESFPSIHLQICNSHSLLCVTFFNQFIPYKNVPLASEQYNFHIARLQQFGSEVKKPQASQPHNDNVENFVVVYSPTLHACLPVHGLRTAKPLLCT